MKKLYTILNIFTLCFLLLCIVASLIPHAVKAISPSPSAVTPTSPSTKPDDTSLFQQIDTLKQKIASKVAQLHLVEKRGWIGTVTNVSNNQITISDLQNNTRFVDVDEITSFSSPNKKSFGVSDVTKNMQISILGIFNKDSRRLLARYVNVVTLPTYLSGEIVSIDQINGTFVLQSHGNKSQNVDVENFTKTYSFSQLNDLTKIGFSKLTVGDRVIIIGYPDSKNAALTVASRILQFPEAPKNPGITIKTSPSTSTPSGVLSPTSSATH